MTDVLTESELCAIEASIALCAIRSDPESRDHASVVGKLCHTVRAAWRGLRSLERELVTWRGLAHSREKQLRELASIAKNYLQAVDRERAGQPSASGIEALRSALDLAASTFS